MKSITEIRWHGRGGQGVVTAGKLLAEAALETGLYFQAFPDYGPERMGAPIRAFTRLSNEPINIHSQIYEPNVVIVLDPTLFGRVPVAEGLKDDGVIVGNTPLSPAVIREIAGFKTGRVCTVDASHIAIDELGREITNTPMLGAFSAATGLFGQDILSRLVKTWFNKKLSAEAVQANVRALERAGREIQEG